MLFPVCQFADTYDKHTLVAITVSSPEELQALYACKVDIVGRRGGVYKALLTDDELLALTHQGFKIGILYDEMAEDRRLWKEADEASAAKAPSAYYTASKFSMTSPPSGSLMEHLLALYNAHTDVCRLYDLGATQDGAYDIIAMKVSKNPDVVEAEPKIRIYGNIHGDEKIACMVACDVLDTILAGYTATPQDATAERLVDGTEMWFIPMGNPWGNANNTRYNSRSIDLNRNFWGPNGNDDCYPQPCTNTPWTEKETQAIRDLTEAVTADHSKKRFTVSISFHSGDEVFNSVWNYTDAAPTDEPIFWSSRTGGTGCGSQDVPSCPTLAPNGLAQAYKNGCTQPGFWFTEGYDWYGTNGDTNDWSYGEWTGLDTTIELDTTKTPAVGNIATDCGYHRQAVLNYMLKAFQGIHGVMADAATGTPLDGTVAATCTASSTIPVPHAYSAIYTDPVAGDFHRVLQPGTYTLTCQCAGRSNLVIPGIVVQADAMTKVNCTWSKPDLAVAGRAFTDSCSGGGAGSGDGYLDPGEDATLQVTLSNYGEIQATNVSATLSTSVPGITITQASASFPNIAGLGGMALSQAPYFAFNIGTEVTCGTVITFALHMVSAEKPSGWDDSIALTVGHVVTGGTVTAFSEAFSSVTAPALPAGWTTQVVTGGTWATNASGCTGNALRYPGTSAAANSWAFTPGLSLTAGVTYMLTFNEKVSVVTYPQKLAVTVGATANSATQTTTIYTNTNLNNTTCAAGSGTFTVPSTGTYYLGFHCTSAAANGRYLYVDDILLTYTVQPSCTVHACSPASPPPETAPGGTLGTAQTWSSDTVQQWPSNAQATGYKVYRGVFADLKNLVSGTVNSCLEWSGSSTSLTVADDPSSVAGRFYWYLVTGTNGMGEGPAGNATGPTARIIDSSGACP